MSKKDVKPRTEVEVGTGNVFEQLGLPNPEERLRKARLMNVINFVMERKGLSRRDAAKATGLDQADISRIQHGRGGRYSTDRLSNILAHLGTGVDNAQYHRGGDKLDVEVREVSLG
jgi:predicted XRE-type DNA-binding protein